MREVQNIVDPLSVRIQFKEEPKEAEDERKILNPLPMIKSLITKKHSNDSQQDPSHSDSGTVLESKGHGFSESFNCDECDYKSNSNEHFNQHLREVHNRGELFECEDCEYKVGRKRSFNAHMWMAHQKGNCHRCQHCGFASPHLNHFNTHMRTVHGEREQFQCEDCEYISQGRNKIKHHTKSVHGKDHLLDCGECEFRSSSLNTLQRHVVRIHHSSRNSIATLPAHTTRTYSRSTNETIILRPFEPALSDIDKDIQSDQKDTNLETSDDQVYLADQDTDTASETESLHLNVDLGTVPKLHNTPNSPGNKGMQVKNDYLLKHELLSAPKYNYHEVQEYLSLSPIKKPLFPDSAQKDDMSVILHDREGPLDIDLAFETESPNWHDCDGHKNKIDVDPMPSPHKIFHPLVFQEQFNFLKKEPMKKSQGVQVDVAYTMKNELISLRAQVKTLQQMNKELKETAENKVVETTGTSECVQSTPKILVTRLEEENEFSWTKKLKFYTKLTQVQCSTLYDSLDAKAKEVLLTVVSQASPGPLMTTGRLA